MHKQSPDIALEKDLASDAHAMDPGITMAAVSDSQTEQLNLSDGHAGNKAQKEYLERLEKNIAKGKAASGQAYNEHLLEEKYY